MRQSRQPDRRTVLKTVGAGVLGTIALSGPAAGQANGGLQHELAEVRAATARYNDPENALADGYIAEDQAVCGMGYHYLDEDLVAAFQGKPGALREYLASRDRTEPPILVYGETDDGLVLGAVEYMTFDPATDLFPATEKDHWHPFFGPLYALHAWVHIPNPMGVFYPTNPRHQFSRPEWCDDGNGHH